jgi:hypothetical protein
VLHHHSMICCLEQLYMVIVCPQIDQFSGEVGENFSINMGV